MKKIVRLTPFLLLCLLACNDAGQNMKSENDVDAARNFIQAALNGDYNKARGYMLPNQINEQRMDAIERVPLRSDEKKGLAEASINIHNVSKINDTATIVIYSNSFKNDWDTLRVIKQKDQWLVDFNYYFTHDSDSSLAVPDLKDNTPK